MSLGVLKTVVLDMGWLGACFWKMGLWLVGDGGCMMEVLVFFEIGGGVWFDGGGYGWISGWVCLNSGCSTYGLLGL